MKSKNKKSTLVNLLLYKMDRLNKDNPLWSFLTPKKPMLQQTLREYTPNDIPLSINFFYL